MPVVRKFNLVDKPTVTITAYQSSPMGIAILTTETDRRGYMRRHTTDIPANKVRPFIDWLQEGEYANADDTGSG